MKVGQTQAMTAVMLCMHNMAVMNHTSSQMAISAAVDDVVCFEVE